MKGSKSIIFFLSPGNPETCFSLFPLFGPVPPPFLVSPSFFERSTIRIVSSLLFHIRIFFFPLCSGSFSPSVRRSFPPLSFQSSLWVLSRFTHYSHRFSLPFSRSIICSVRNSLLFSAFTLNPPFGGRPPTHLFPS